MHACYCNNFNRQAIADTPTMRTSAPIPEDDDTILKIYHEASNGKQPNCFTCKAHIVEMIHDHNAECAKA
ncbi:MAG: hypothetical protein JKY71_03710 [Alphaproteobacteria bacterium]|nr:hypothetical protein [Alphaproteobacteria bacterium]